MIPSDAPTWLSHDVPLWAFLIALLTSPAKWSELVNRRIRERFGTDE